MYSRWRNMSKYTQSKAAEESIYSNCSWNTNFNTASSTSSIQTGECSQYILQSLKITTHSSRPSLLCKFPSFSGVHIGGVELHHSKNPTESHRVHKLEGFRGCPVCIRKCTQYGWKRKFSVFSSILLLWFQHEGSKIFIQETLGG